MKVLVPLVACLALLTGCASGAGYLFKQGRYLLRDSTGTRPVQSLIDSPATAPDTKEFLRRVQEIKRFAVDDVGLKDNANYTRYKQLDRDHLVDVVSASDALSFTPYLWHYPFLGGLPYKGFYVPADAQGEAARLKKEGYDVITRPVDAFSTLGFTKDPVYSFMARYSPFALASVIIHEQTHATLFVKGQPQFNEELATFVGDEGAFEWLARRYGAQSPELRTAREEDADTRTFIALLQGVTQTLTALYAGPATREEKLSRKAQILDEFQKSLVEKAATLFHTEGYRKLGHLSLNNAYLSLYSLYSDDIPLLRSYWQERCGSDLRRFMQAAEALAKKGDVKALMRAELSAAAKANASPLASPGAS
jgi:predicted aminopeptidase